MMSPSTLCFTLTTPPAPQRSTLRTTFGSGAGQAAAELASRIKHVIASDIEIDHLNVTRSRLKQLSIEQRISYTLSRGEDLVTKHPSQSANMIATPEAIALMDPVAALSSFATVLKPGGTLATCFYGRPTFADGDLLARARPLLDEIMVREWTNVIRGSGAKR